MSSKKVIDLRKAMKSRKVTHDKLAKRQDFKSFCIDIAEELYVGVFGKPKYAINSSFVGELPNTLREEFRLKLQPTLSTEPIDDLNLISDIEKSIGLIPAVLGPGATETNPTGYLSIFTLSECFFSSPEMENENLARAFSILLFIKAEEFLKEM